MEESLRVHFDYSTTIFLQEGTYSNPRKAGFPRLCFVIQIKMGVVRIRRADGYKGCFLHMHILSFVGNFVVAWFILCSFK